MVYHLPVCVLRVSNESCLAVDGLFCFQAEIPDRPICWLLQTFEPSVDPEVFHAVVCLQPSARWVQDWPSLWITQHVIGHRWAPICPVFANTSAQVWPEPFLRRDSFLAIFLCLIFKNWLSFDSRSLWKIFTTQLFSGSWPAKEDLFLYWVISQQAAVCNLFSLPYREQYFHTWQWTTAARKRWKWSPDL